MHQPAHHGPQEGFPRDLTLFRQLIAELTVELRVSGRREEFLDGVLPGSGTHFREEPFASDSEHFLLEDQFGADFHPCLGQCVDAGVLATLRGLLAPPYLVEGVGFVQHRGVGVAVGTQTDRRKGRGAGEAANGCPRHRRRSPGPQRNHHRRQHPSEHHRGIAGERTGPAPELEVRRAGIDLAEIADQFADFRLLLFVAGGVGDRHARPEMGLLHAPPEVLAQGDITHHLLEILVGFDLFLDLLAEKEKSPATGIGKHVGAGLGLSGFESGGLGCSFGLLLSEF